MSRHSAPAVDMTTPAGRAGLTQRQSERAVTRPSKPAKNFSASLHFSAEDLADAIVQMERLEQLAREHGFEVRVYAVGGGADG